MKKICSCRGFGRGTTEAIRSDPARHDVRGVGQVLRRFVQKRRQNGGSPIPSITMSSWLSASRPGAAIIPPGNMKFAEPVDDAGVGDGPRLARSANSRSRHARVSSTRSPVGVSAPFGP